MRRWIRYTLAGLLGAALLGGGLFACAHHAMHGMSDGERAAWRQKMVDRAADKLELDAAQKAKLDALAQVMAAQRGKVVGSTNPRSELLGLIGGEKFDRTRGQAWIDARSAALHEAAPAVLNAAGDFYDSLRPEQQAKLRDYVQRGHRHGAHG